MRFAEALRQFRGATDPVIRNKLALDLGDSRRPEARTALVRALRDPATKGARGSIVYALLVGEFNCGNILHDLVECVISGSFEEVDHALEILGRTEIPLPQPELAARLDHALRTAEVLDWRCDALEECIALFTE